MTDCKPDIKLSILLTGNELLEGSIIDSNSVFISVELLQYGIRTSEKRIVGDASKDLKNAILDLTSQNDLLIINGGLGATVDDLTASVVADVCNQKLTQNVEAMQHLTEVMSKRYGKPTLQLPDYLKRQALLPENCITIPNPVGAALGFKVTINDCICYFTPGVPNELKAMFSDFILPEIISSHGLMPQTMIEKRNILGVGEYRVQKILFDILDETEIKKLNIGFRAVSPHVELKISPAVPAVDIKDIMERIDQCFGEYIFSSSCSLEESLINLIRQDGKTLATAESCTGGLIASRITQVSGVSDIFSGGVVSYSNEMKEEYLDIPFQLLREKGAVSKEVAEEMVKGVLKKSNASYAISVTGIAGPSGGDKEKPVGTVYVAIGDKDSIFVRKLRIERSRNIFQSCTATVALDLLRRFIKGEDLECYYYFDSLSNEKFLPHP